MSLAILGKLGELEKRVANLEGVLQRVIGAGYEPACLTEIYLEHARRLEALEARECSCSKRKRA